MISTEILYLYILNSTINMDNKNTKNRALLLVTLLITLYI